MTEKEIFRAGFMAGFLESAEGYNAEYPYCLFSYDKGQNDADNLRECEKDLLDPMEKAFAKLKEKQ